MSADRRSRPVNLLSLLSLLSVTVGLAVFLGRVSAAAEPAYWTWFKYGEGVTETWQISEVEGDPLRVSIRSKDVPAHRRLRRILVVYPRPSSAYDTAITKILHVFTDKDVKAEITVINFKKADALGKAALRLAEAGEYELIFSMGSESTAWLYKNYRGGSIPVVSVCSKDPVQLGQMQGYDVGSGTNFAFTSLNMPVEAQMAYVLELKPNLKNIAVLVDSKNVSAVQTQANPVADYARRRGIRVLNIAVRNPKKAREELARLVPKAVATMRKNDPDLNNSVFWITGSTSVFNEIATINARSDRVPVLSVVPEVVKAGEDSAVLSVGISFQSNAHLAAIYAAEVLSGRVEAGDLKVGVVSPPDIAINFRKAREIGLRIPFSFFESATFVYDYDGQTVRNNGKSIAAEN
ncbi:MAG: ABC transporter substrate-binding protein [Kiloniellaceae bacterium]